MISHWAMPTPGLVCSVQSGNGNYNTTFEEPIEEADNANLAEMLRENTPANNWGASATSTTDGDSADFSPEKDRSRYEGKMNELMKGVCAASVECGAWLTSDVPTRNGGMSTSAMFIPGIKK